MISVSFKLLFIFLLLLFLVAYYKELPAGTNSVASENIWSDLMAANPRFIGLEPAEYPHCGFHVLLESYEAAPSKTLEKIQEFKRQDKSKIYNVITSPSGHFTINYEPTTIPTYDRDQNGTPDYLEFVANSFDRAWSVEIDNLGFKPPPDPNGQPKAIYEITCKNFNNLYGSTLFDLTEDISSLPGNNYPSSIQISTNFSFVNYEGVIDPIVRDSMAIAVTAAHEFNHALQLGYNIWNSSQNTGTFEYKDFWYIENSATYMEEVVANEVNDYYFYLPGFFATTDEGLTSGVNRVYGEAILNIMLGQIYGKTITREVWEEIVNQPAIASIEKVVRRKGSNFDREMHRLAEWMYFCGKYSIPGKFFPEGANYPTVDFDLADDFSTGSQKIFENELPPFAIQYIKNTISSKNNLNIYLVPDDMPDVWGAVAFDNSAPYTYHFPANVYSQLPFQSMNTVNDTLATAVVSSNWNDGDTDSPIHFSLFLRDFDENLTNDILVYPTVLKPDQHVDYITFKNVPPSARIELFSATGNHLNTIHPRFSSDTIYWNLKTAAGDFVGSGVYIYSIESPEFSQKGKIVVIR